MENIEELYNRLREIYSQNENADPLTLEMLDSLIDTASECETFGEVYGVFSELLKGEAENLIAEYNVLNETDWDADDESDIYDEDEDEYEYEDEDDVTPGGMSVAGFKGLISSVKQCLDEFGAGNKEINRLAGIMSLVDNKADIGDVTSQYVEYMLSSSPAITGMLGRENSEKLLEMLNNLSDIEDEEDDADGDYDG